jgi:hypothetical protein
MQKNRDKEISTDEVQRRKQYKKSRRRLGCLSVVSFVRYHEEVSATGRSLVQRSPTDCCVSLCVIQKPQE